MEGNWSVLDKTLGDSFLDYCRSKNLITHNFFMDYHDWYLTEKLGKEHESAYDNWLEKIIIRQCIYDDDGHYYLNSNFEWLFEDFIKKAR